jgi:hypothetical protein
MVFSEVDDVKGSMAVRQIFGSIESSAGRRSALEKLSEVYFHPYQDDPVIKTPFTQLMEGFSRASNLRDDIAHGKVITFKVDGVAKGAFMLPSDYNSGRNSPFMPGGDEPLFSMMRGKYRYVSSDILYIKIKFYHMRQVIFTYLQSITKENGVLRPILERLRQLPQKSE